MMSTKLTRWKDWSGQQDSNLRPPAPKRGESVTSSRAVLSVLAPFPARHINGLIAVTEWMSPVLCAGRGRAC
jgi:hypothetical protein